MVALARHFGDLDLSQARIADHDLVFFTAPGPGLVTYPVWVARMLAVAAAALFVALLIVGWRRRHLRVQRLAAGEAVVLVFVPIVTAANWAVWRVLLALNPDSARTLHYPDFALSTTAMVVLLTTMAVAFAAASYWISRRIGAVELTSGALVWWTVVALLLAVGEPLFSPVGLWPLVGGIVALAAIILTRRPWPRAAVLVLVAVPGLVVLAPLLVLETLNVEHGQLVATPVLLLLLGTLLPQLLSITTTAGRDPTFRAVSGAQVTPGRLTSGSLEVTLVYAPFTPTNSSLAGHEPDIRVAGVADPPVRVLATRVSSASLRRRPGLGRRPPAGGARSGWRACDRGTPRR